MNHKYMTIAIYLRISEEDRDINDEKNSRSILNQKKLILSYINDKEEFDGCKIMEFIDDGYSGMNFERPDFKRMLEVVEQQQIDVIITKDYSRLGRDYIIVGNYVERIFPLLGVRYISVNDKYDSGENLGKTQDLDAGIKGILNTLYCKDLSVKIKASMRTLLDQKKYIASRAPFGYKKSTENKYKLVVDPEAAVIVKQIFDMCLNGYSTGKIASKLNEQHSSILDYYEKKGWKRKKSIYEEGCKSMWTTSSINNILHNEVYTGKIIANKNVLQKEGGKKKHIINDRSKWIIKENCHEPIIPQEVFDRVQTEMLKRRYGKKKNSRKGFVRKRGFILCGYCGRSMLKRKTIYSCTLHRIRVSKSEMEKAVLNVINSCVDRIEDSDKKLYNQTVSEKKSLDIIESIDIKLKKLHKQKFDIYDSYTRGKVSREQLMVHNAEIAEQISLWQSKRDKQKNILLQIRKQDNVCLNSVASLDDSKKFITFNREELENVMDSIVVHSEKEIEICWKTKEHEKILLE